MLCRTTRSSGLQLSTSGWWGEADRVQKIRVTEEVPLEGNNHTKSTKKGGQDLSRCMAALLRKKPSRKRATLKKKKP